jgi:hypothetical protein
VLKEKEKERSVVLGREKLAIYILCLFLFSFSVSCLVLRVSGEEGCSGTHLRAAGVMQYMKITSN